MAVAEAKPQMCPHFGEAIGLKVSGKPSADDADAVLFCHGEEEAEAFDFPLDLCSYSRLWSALGSDRMNEIADTNG